MLELKLLFPNLTNCCISTCITACNIISLMTVFIPTTVGELVQSVGDKNGRCLTRGGVVMILKYVICCLSSDPHQKYKFSALRAVSGSRHLK
jgi:hypothetical protein